VPDPRIRRRARERAMQFLFGLDFTGCEWESAIEAFWDANPSRPGVKAYARRLIAGVCANRASLDEAIAEVLRNWSPERVARVERTILRIALYEMRHMPDVPPNVAINEAIEVAKQYGSDEAPRFVNGVLDRLKNSPAAEKCNP
jgi:N utilization substance protein B